MDLGLLITLVFVGALAVVIVLLARSERKNQAQREADWRADASARGWAFETGRDADMQLMRWTGQTDGLAWTLEYRRGRHKHRSTNDRAQRVRWWADAFHGPGAPVLCMGVSLGQERPAVKLAQGEGLFATLARKAAGAVLDKTLDVYFGEEAGRQVDARELKMVDDVIQPGYIVMATNPGIATHWLAGERGAALGALVHESLSALHPDVGRPWVLWQGRRVMLAAMRPVDKPEDVVLWVNTGVQLAEAGSSSGAA